MKHKYTTISIIGPTTAGKTELAIHLARRYQGSLVCCDILQFYQGLEIGSGRASNIELAYLSTKLYGINSPDKPYLSPEQYKKMAYNVIAESFSNNLLPIFEGCTTRYIRVLKDISDIGDFGHILMLGIFPEESYERLCQKIRIKIQSAHKRGLMSEIKDLVAHGYQNIKPLQDGILYRYFIPHALGKMSYEKAVERTTSDWAKVYYDQLASMRELPGIVALDSNTTKAHTFETIETLMPQLKLRRQSNWSLICALQESASGIT